MTGRAFWFAMGAGAGLYSSLRARRLAYRLTPPGVADQVAALGVGARAFADEVRIGMTEREGEMARQLGLAAERAPRPASVEQGDLRPRALAAPDHAPSL
ncbi:MAG: hypothetical protein H0V48_07105 [Nocardioidaceae bacterium]|nr:hypothetical protein [Nocardioidaceae bacterium]